MKDRSLLPFVAAALLLLPVATGVQSAASGADQPIASVPVRAVGPIGLTVSDMARAVDFYTRVLPFETVADIEQSGRPFELEVGVFGAHARTVTLRLGEETIALTEYLAPRGRPIPSDFRPNDVAFQHVALIVSNMPLAYAQLRAHGVKHGSTGPQRLPDWNPNASGITAFYFRDPDDHFLEILQFPPDKGAAKWHRGAPLFLGIDHTAIVSTSTDRSLSFYRDLLGMRVAGESENFDVEQEHLNNVFGARLRITALRAATGPGIELLEYLAPGNGRAAPTDMMSNDIGHWQTTLRVQTLEMVPTLARRHLVSLVSPLAVKSSDGMAGWSMLIRDPDAHAMRLVTSQ